MKSLLRLKYSCLCADLVTDRRVPDGSCLLTQRVDEAKATLIQRDRTATAALNDGDVEGVKALNEDIKQTRDDLRSVAVLVCDVSRAMAGRPVRAYLQVDHREESLQPDQAVFTVGVEGSGHSGGDGELNKR